ncbi:MAG: hypothetical protein R3F49_10125 [Planctomycetota bacterium]
MNIACLSAALAALVTLAPLSKAAPVAAAQSEATWIAQHRTTGRASLRALELHPAGGAVVALTWGTTVGSTEDVDDIEVRWISEDGDWLWRALPPTLPGMFLDLAVDGAGNVAVATEALGQVWISCLDTTGSLRWTVEAPSVAAGASFRLRALGFAAAGEVLVTGIQDAFNTPPFDGRASVLALDLTTGQTQWRVDRPAIYDAIATIAGGEAFVVYTGFPGLLLDRIGGGGQLVYSAPVPNATRILQGDGIAADGAGRAALSLRSSFYTTGPNVLTFDANGGLAWSNTLQLDFGGTVTFTTSGDVVVCDRAYRRDVWRMDGVGAVLWQRSAPSNVNIYGYGPLAATPSDGVVLASADTLSSQNAGVGLVQAIDAAGTTSWVETLPGLAWDSSRFTSLAVDSRGNVWAGLSRLDGSGQPFEGAAAKIVAGGDPSTAYCAPSVANSTGASGALRAAGSVVAAHDNVTLLMGSLPEGAPVLVLNSRAAGSVPGAGGSQGTLCLGGAIGRYVGVGQVRRANAAGLAWLQLELSNTPTPTGARAVLAGETWNFQAWHRDANPGPTSNFTNAISVLFQ